MNVVISKPETASEAIHKRIALSKKPNRPSDNTLSGNVSNFNIGLIKIFISPITAAAISFADVVPANEYGNWRGKKPHQFVPYLNYKFVLQSSRPDRQSADNLRVALWHSERN